MGCPLNDDATPSTAESLWGVPSPGESRWPVSIAVLAIIGVQLRLPEKLSFGPRWALPVIAGVIFVALVLANPSKLDRESRDLRLVSVALIGVLSAGNAASLVLVLHELIVSGSTVSGRSLLYAGAEVWATNALAFGIWYWEIDRGGPIARCRPDHAPPDFIFPQMENPGVLHAPWSPRFVDYLYLSLTNSTAFSPTDTLPLTIRAKLLMAAQSITSLATIVVVGARAVNILH